MSPCARSWPRADLPPYEILLSNIRPRLHILSVEASSHLHLESFRCWSKNHQQHVDFAEILGCLSETRSEMCCDMLIAYGRGSMRHKNRREAAEREAIRRFHPDVLARLNAALPINCVKARMKRHKGCLSLFHHCRPCNRDILWEYDLPQWRDGTADGGNGP